MATIGEVKRELIMKYEYLEQLEKRLDDLDGLSIEQLGVVSPENKKVAAVNFLLEKTKKEGKGDYEFLRPTHDILYIGNTSEMHPFSDEDVKKAAAYGICLDLEDEVFFIHC